MELANGEADPPADEVERRIAPKSGRLVLLRSRDMVHEVLPCKRKRFAMSMYMAGPVGPGDTAVKR